MFGESKGQAFSVFKILIGAVFAVALLVIVYMSVSQYNYPYTAFESARSVVLQAQKSPFDCFSRQEVLFSQNEILANNLNIESIDLEFKSKSTDMFSCPGGSCTVLVDVKAPISAVCQLPSPPSKQSCEIYIGSNNCK